MPAAVSKLHFRDGVSAWHTVSAHKCWLDEGTGGTGSCQGQLEMQGTVAPEPGDAVTFLLCLQGEPEDSAPEKGEEAAPPATGERRRKQTGEDRTGGKSGLSRAAVCLRLPSEALVTVVCIFSLGRGSRRPFKVSFSL